MSNEAYSYDDVQPDQGFEEPGAPVADGQGEDYQQSAMAARPVPRISIQCFCDDPATADAIQYAAQIGGCRRRRSACTWEVWLPRSITTRRVRPRI